MSNKVFSKIKKKALVGAVATGIVISALQVASCTKNAPCLEQSLHAHYYSNEENGLGRYIVSEKETVDGLERTDEIILINEQNKELLDFMTKKDLFSINGNLQAINALTSEEPYIEYEYTHKKLGTAIEMSSGGLVIVRKDAQSWTKDPDGDYNYTGLMRIVSNVYHAYKVEKNERTGKYFLVRSDNYKNLSDLPAEYQYIKLGDYMEKEYDNDLLHVVDFIKAQEAMQEKELD